MHAEVERTKSSLRVEEVQFCEEGCGSDFKQIVTMLRHIKDKTHKDGQKKTEQAISRLVSNIRRRSSSVTTKRPHLSSRLSPGTLIDEGEEEEELQVKQSIVLMSNHRITCTCNCCCSNL